MLTSYSVAGKFCNFYLFSIFTFYVFYTSDTLVYYYVIVVSYENKRNQQRNIREVGNSSKCKIQSMPHNRILVALKNYGIY